jgi:hypothetical protein
LPIQLVVVAVVGVQVRLVLTEQPLRLLVVRVVTDLPIYFVQARMKLVQVVVLVAIVFLPMFQTEEVAVAVIRLNLALQTLVVAVEVIPQITTMLGQVVLAS